MATIHFLVSLLLPLLFLSPSYAAPTFTAKASAIRYWNRKVPNNQPIPPFLLSRLSPLSAADSALYSSLAPSALSSRLTAFCSSANILCAPSLPSDQAGSISQSNYVHALYKATMASHSPKQSVAGQFFKESDLAKGKVMPMKDIRDRSPVRSFLPRSIAAKLPFSAAGVEATFHIPAGSETGKGVADTVALCGLPTNPGESKRCPTSVEDMIDFATSVLETGDVAAYASTGFGSASRLLPEEAAVLVGEVKGVNGGRAATPVSCHQSPFPYMVYYCHSVPNVKLYEAEILKAETEEKMGNAVAICHMDTSEWSPEHVGLKVLGAAPGETEVCHWIYEGDMVWTVRG